MKFTADFLANMARTAGLNVFMTDGANGHEQVRMRISAGQELHLVVTLMWDGGKGTEDIITAKLVEVALPDTHVFPAQFGNVDNFGDARAMAMLGWVVREIQDMANRKAREDARARKVA